MADTPPAPLGGMSLYADLLDGGSKEAADKAHASAASTPAPKPEAPKNPALRFQPVIRRPQQTKAKAKPKLPAATATPGTATATATATTTASTATMPSTSLPRIAFAPPSNRTTLADWTKGGDDDDDDDDGEGGGDYGGGGANSQKWQQRGGRKRKKKRHDDRHGGMARGADVWVDWDEVYDPTRPTNLEAYMHSDERVSAAIEWKGVLYAHRRRKASIEKDGPDETAKPNAQGTSSGTDTDSAEGERPHGLGHAFAPPPAAAFAPPLSYNVPAAVPPPPPPLAETEAPVPGLVVSKAPVRFEAAATARDTDLTMKDGDDGDDDYRPSFAFDMGDRPADAGADQQQLPPPRSNRPGQAGFAARLMAKYGWTKGTGLGADESGIINPLRHKRVNAGAGSTGPAMGRIVGGQKKKTAESGGSPSPVIVLRNMVDGIPDLAAEVADGQLVQEIGEECGEQYGRIERVYIDVPSQLVFIKFTETVSALRAVNALNGRIFNGSAITPSFYDAEKFEAGIYQ